MGGSDHKQKKTSFQQPTGFPRTNFARVVCRLRMAERSSKPYYSFESIPAAFRCLNNCDRKNSIHSTRANLTILDPCHFLMSSIRIGAGAGYSGDRIQPALDLIERGQLDYIIFECLAERTIALAQQAKSKDPDSWLRSVARDPHASGSEVLPRERHTPHQQHGGC